MPSWLPEAVRVALAIGLGSVIGRELRRRFAHKMAMAEMDEVQAEQQQAEWVETRTRSGMTAAVVPVRPMPEWEKRLRRKVMGLGRLGERINNNGAKR